MSKVVVGVFHDRDQAESALEDLKNEGFEKDISLVARDEEKGGMSMENQDLTEGAFTGGALGGIAGLLAGAGALLIPGVGPIIAAGPIAATLTGVVTGGIAGSLVDYGIPEERGEYYEEQVRQGGILLTVKSSDEHIDEAASIMRNHGAGDVETHRSSK
ncbi:MAG TPA: general stress protein [Bacillota bacterium]|nr:general stress protein [Bacillota bacterium]